MSASESIVRTASAREQPAEGLGAAKQPLSFEAALEELGEAVAARKCEAICIAYLVLRRAGRGMPPREILDAADRAAGESARRTIISAFGRRRCYMCEGGTVRCPTCQGEGVSDGLLCPQCDGLGVERCDFCMGTGLSDLDAVPEELRPAVARRRAGHVDYDLAKLDKLPEPEALRRIQGTAGQRRDLASWLMRLRGRLTHTAARGGNNGDGRARRLAEAVVRIDLLLEAVRPPYPRTRPRPEAEDE
jgi:hypothetical protein